MSFYRTVIDSPQWKAWEVYQANQLAEENFKVCYDMAEVVEIGIISQKHFQDFLSFCERKYVQKRP